jgi:hypothetical protein
VHQIIVFPATIEQDEDLPVVPDDIKEQADQDIQSTKSIQHEKVKEKERTNLLQIEFDETQNDIVDEHPALLL